MEFVRRINEVPNAKISLKSNSSSSKKYRLNKGLRKWILINFWGFLLKKHTHKRNKIGHKIFKQVGRHFYKHFPHQNLRLIYTNDKETY